MSNTNKTNNKESIEQVPDIILLNLLRTHLVFESLLKQFINMLLWPDPRTKWRECGGPPEFTGRGMQEEMR